MRAESYISLIEMIVGSVLSAGGLIIMHIGDVPYGIFMTLFGLLMLLGLAKKVVDITLNNKEWRNEIV